MGFTTAAAILRFGAFELDVRAGELRRSGVLIRLSPQQFRLLRYLAERTGQISTREEIQQEIWGTETFVDFDRGLNVCIAQIRAALNDDSEAPRFIQTVPRKGYRFVAPVEQLSGSAGSSPPPTPVRRVPGKRTILAIVGVGVTIVAAILLLLPSHRKMLAVMPFENLTQRAEDGPAIDGLADELITQFGSVDPDRLGVIGRTSVMRYGNRKPGLAAIGKELGVDYVLEGGLRDEAGRLRVSARLVKVADQAQVWSDTYEEDAAARPELPDEVAARVTIAVLGRLFPGSVPSAKTAHVPNAAAREAFDNGRYLRRKRSRDDAERAIAWFAQAGERDPQFAEPWAAMAETYVGLAMSGAVPGGEAFPKARTAAERALRLRESAEAQNALANVCFWFDWNWEEARQHFERAIALNPSMAQAHHDYAFYLVAVGRTPAGLTSLRRAIALDPLSPQINLDAGWLLLQAHHFDDAIRQAKRALELEPNLSEANGCIGRALAYQGKAGPAVMEFYRRVASNGKDPYNRALALAVLGQNSDALRELETAYAQHSTLMPLAGTEPAFTVLHQETRFQEITRKVGRASARTGF